LALSLSFSSALTANQSASALPFGKPKAVAAAPAKDKPTTDAEADKPTEGEIKGAPEKKGAYSEAAVKLYNRGVELHQAGFLNQAINEYRAAIDAEPRMEEAYSNLGGIYAAQRSYTKAIEAFEKALQLKPDRPTTLNGYGTVLYAHGRLEDAKAKWKQAVQIDPTFASAYYNLGNALEGEKKTSEAIDAYAKAIEVNANMADAYYRIGSLYAKSKHYAQSRLLLNKSLELAPEADFVRDARKQLASLNTLLQADSSDDEMKVNVMTPQTSAPVDNQTAAADGAPSQPAGEEGQEKKKKFGLFPKKKAEKEKKVDMFVQSPGAPAPQAASSPPAGEDQQDLKEKPPE